ncbi:hypothetical protein BDZ45DRAFT_674319 [Acephala macrosclerotiorum]|nr:hypothetical protein BDZ45DRAFT_674319 [Acephala macrosclerotiorum]
MNSNKQNTIADKQSRKPVTYNTTQPQKKCRNFSRGHCKFGDKCKFLHESKQPANSTTAVSNHQQEVAGPAKSDAKPMQCTWAQAAAKAVAPVVVAKPAFKTQYKPKPKPKSVAKIEPSSPLSTASSLVLTSTVSSPPSGSSLTSLESTSWDPTVSHRSWAEGKLLLTTKCMFLAPYIVAGEVTAQLLTYGLGDQKSDEFHYFPHLPGEIRNKIWGFALQDTVNNCTIKWDRNVGEDVVYQFGDGFEAVSPEPAILLVNQESRSFAIGQYELTFGTNYDSAKVMLNYERDRLFVITKGNHQIGPIFKLMLKRDTQRIVRLALPLRDAYVDVETIGQAVSKCRNLKAFELVVGNSKTDEPFSHDKKIVRKVKDALEFYWVNRWGTRGDSPSVPKVRIDVIDGVDAHFYGIDNVEWYVGQDTETFNWRRTGQHLNLATRARNAWIDKLNAAAASRRERRRALAVGH